MPTYVYEALNEAGQPQKGEITAPSSEEAISRIRSQGYFPTSVREQKFRKKPSRPKSAGAGPAAATKKAKWYDKPVWGRVSTKSITTMTRQLSTLQDAGLPILRSLSILEQQQKRGTLKRILMEVHDEVSGGSALSDALAKHPKAFNKLYTKMIAAGEVGGVLDQILERLADFMEKAARLRRRVIGAMIYPSVVMVVACLILVGIMVFIVPTFEEIFEDFRTTLPALTQGLIYTSRWFMGSAYPNQLIPGVVYVMLAPIVLVFAIAIARKTTAGRRVLDSLLLKIPIIGGLVSKTTIARFSRTLGTLISAGVPILDAILITRDTSSNYVFHAALQDVHDSVRRGESFSDPLRKTRVCDAIVSNMIDVGEETGELDKMLMKIADNYDEEVDVAVNSLVSLLEPVLVVVLGGTVGLIVVALYTPMISLVESINR